MAAKGEIVIDDDTVVQEKQISSSSPRRNSMSTTIEPTIVLIMRKQVSSRLAFRTSQKESNPSRLNGNAIQFPSLMRKKWRHLLFVKVSLAGLMMIVLMRLLTTPNRSRFRQTKPLRFDRPCFNRKRSMGIRLCVIVDGKSIAITNRACRLLNCPRSTTSLQ